MSLRKVDRAVEFLQRLGLNDNDIRVYVMLIDSPLLSVGEIQQSLGNTDLINVLEAINELSDIGLVKAVDGDIKRYYANLPFLREAVTVERETIISLNSLITSIEEKIAEIKKKHNVIENMSIPDGTEKLLENIDNKLFNPLESDLKMIKETINETLFRALQTIDNLSEDTNNKLKKLVYQLEEVNKEIEKYTSIFNIESIFEDLTGKISQAAESSLKKAQDDIKVRFVALKSAVNKFNQSTDKSISNYLEFLNLFVENRRELVKEFDQLGGANKFANDYNEKILGYVKSSKDKAISLIETDETISSTMKMHFDQIFSDLDDQIRKGSLQELETIISKYKSMLDDDISQISSSMDSSKELKDKLSEMQIALKENYDKIGSSINSGLNEVHQTVNKDLESREGQIKENQQIIITNMENLTSKSIGLLKTFLDDSVKEFEDTNNNMKERLEKMFDVPKTFIETIEETMQPLKEEEKKNFQEFMDKVLVGIHEEIKANEISNINLLKERINFAKSMIEGRGTDLKAILSMSDGYKIKAPVNTGIVLGLPAIYATLSDLVLRAKRKVIVVTPTFDEAIFDLAVKNRSTISYTIVSEISEDRHKKYISKAKDIGTISLMQYSGKDLYACFRDDAEIVFGYVIKGEEVTAVRSTQSSMIDLFKDRFNETIVRKAKKLI
jgi:predicted DNA-binding transcriptional regulator